MGLCTHLSHVDSSMARPAAMKGVSLMPLADVDEMSLR